MIFLTVGTHEQPFLRLVQEMDRLAGTDIISEEVIAQIGYTDYKPEHMTFKDFFPYDKTQELAKEARIVITHGGPSSFIMALQNGKVPIVVPRKAEFNEHVNDHQGKFCHAVEERNGNIIVVDDVSKLGDVIKNYDDIVAKMPAGMKSNNARFCEEFERIVENLVSR